MVKQAKIGKEPSIWSDRFLTGAHGYNFMVCIYPNGDSNGKNTHASLYVCICRVNTILFYLGLFNNKLHLR